jgi:hypothetical protein
MTDPTPLPAAPDWRALCKELLQAIDDDVIDTNDGPRFQAVVDCTRAALATPPAPPLEPRGCPLPGACSCPTTPIVPPELIRALEMAEEALTEIDLELGLRASQLTHIRRALQTWRDHATPPAATREAGPLPQAGLTDEQLLELMPQQFRDDLATVSRLASYGTPVGPGLYRVSLNTGALAYARAVLARWGGAAVRARPASEQPEAGDTLHSTGECWWFDPAGGGAWYFDTYQGNYTYWRPYWALSVPAANKGEVQP